MASAFEKHVQTLGDYIGAFKTVSKQIGAVFGIDGIIAGLELFDSDLTFGKYFMKLVQSYALDAMEDQTFRKREPSVDSIAAFIEEVSTTRTDTYPALGAGQDLRFTTPRTFGGALEYKQQLLHLVAFNRQQTNALGTQHLIFARHRARRRYGRMH